MQITDNILTIDGTQIELPRLPVDTKVRAWSVPVEYRANGYFVSVVQPGQAPERPACGNEGTAFVGELEYPADAGEQQQQEALRIKAEIEAGIDAYIDSVAQAKGYDNRLTCMARAGFEGPFQAEGIAFGQWMDSCYLACFQIMDEVMAELRPVPTVDELIAELPPMVWP